MPRSASTADSELIDFASAQGHEVRPRQLERYRYSGALPKRLTRPGRGKGRGRAGGDAAFVKHQLVALCEFLAKDRNLRRATLRLWYLGWSVSDELVRGWMASSVDGYRRNIANEPDALGFAEREAREGLRRGRRADQSLGRHVADAQVDPHSKKLPPPKTALLSALTQLLHALATDTSEVPEPEAVRRFLRFDSLDGAEGTDSVSGQDVMSASIEAVLPDRLAHVIATASISELREARGFLVLRHEEIAKARQSDDAAERHSAEGIDTRFDPRDPEFTETRLLVAVPVVVALLRKMPVERIESKGN